MRRLGRDMRGERSFETVCELTMLEGELLKWRFRRGSREALARIYEKYVHLLLSIAFLMPPAGASAPDWRIPRPTRRRIRNKTQTCVINHPAGRAIM
jgi:hypothetical protein